MNNQITLESESVSILLGCSLNRQQFDYFKDVYSVKFKQIVVLSSQNLVQLCNFMRRCRAERARGLKHQYLVYLQFQPHRDTWRFISVHKQLGVTLIIGSGPCISFHIREIYPYADYLWEWYKKKMYINRPIIQVYNISNQSVAMLKLVYPNLVSVRETEDSVNDICNEWFLTRNPLNKYASASSFASVDHSAQVPLNQSYNQRDDNPRSQQRPLATETMNLAEACQILHLSESAARSESAVKLAYRKQAIIWHPDKHQNKSPEVIEEAKNTFMKVSEAYHYLLNFITF